MKYAIALLGLLSVAGHASAGDCALPKPPLLGALGQGFRDLAEAASPELHEQRQRERGQRATYEALLAAGAPEQLACAAALNPQLLQTVAPTYFGRSR
jgi:hypothetical protein